MSNTNPHIITINAPSLANNKLNDDAQREVLVYLPPSYTELPSKHYPVLYLMHGFGGNARAWFSDEIPLQEICDQLIASTVIDEMIIIVPENSTNLTCSAYLDSPVQGNWQQFICDDLIEAVSAKYRIKAGWEHRAIAGHSSGGDAVLKTLFLSPGTFKHAFAMSAPRIDASGLSMLKEQYHAHYDALEQASIGNSNPQSLGVWAHIVLCTLQVAFPEVNNAPLFCKFPLKEADWLQLNQGTHTALYQQHKAHLTNVNLGLDVGLKEGFIEKTRQLVKQIKSDGYSVKLVEFNGGHVDHLAQSLPYVLTYISDCFKKNES